MATKTKRSLLVKISEYPYGRVYKRLRDAAQWINTHKRDIKKLHAEWAKEYNSGGIETSFEHPDYWGMPKSISYQLSPDEVDFIQDQTYDYATEMSDFLRKNMNLNLFVRHVGIN